ncbi:uncharacterized protein HaLaN_08640, partial [Haematococcus lacustris]
LRAAREGATSHIRQLEGSLTSLRGELEARRQEVEQLTTLSLRGDATVQEYMSNLKAMSGDLRAAEMRIADLVSELAGCQDALGRAAAESADLRQLVNTLDQERDNLQAELDSHAEQTAEMSSQLQALQAQAADTTRLLAMAEGRLAHADARATDSEAEVARLRNQLGAAMEQLQAVSSERNSLGEELRAVSEDLEALVKENQVGQAPSTVVSNELAATAQQRDAAAAEVRRLTARVNSAEQMVRSKEAEVEDLRRAYESLALDNRRVGQLEREAANREAALAARGDEAASLAEATRAAQAQINQYVMDLQVRLGLERHREELQRQVAGLDSQLAVARARLEDAGAEASSLGQVAALQHQVTALQKSRDVQASGRYLSP